MLQYLNQILAIRAGFSWPVFSNIVFHSYTNIFYVYQAYNKGKGINLIVIEQPNYNHGNRRKFYFSVLSKSDVSEICSRNGNLDNPSFAGLYNRRGNLRTSNLHDIYLMDRDLVSDFLHSLVTRKNIVEASKLEKLVLKAIK